MNDGKMGEMSLVSVKPTDRFKDLTEAGRQLLEVIIDPVSRTLSVTKICEKAGISRDSYYRLWKEPYFQSVYREICQTTCLGSALAAMEALCKNATMGDVQSAKMVLEMAGLYQPQATVTIDSTPNKGPTLLEIYKRRKEKELKGCVE